MWNKIKRATQLVQNMGLRYVAFRVKFALQTKTGLLKGKFPTNPKSKEFITLKKW